MRRLLAWGLVLVVAAGAGAVYVSTRHSARGAGHAAHATATPTPTRSPLLAAVSTVAGPPATSTRGAVTAALASPLGSPALGGGVAAVVVDAGSGRVLEAAGAATPVAPASTAKLLTATAALLALGPDARLRTTVVRDGSTLWLVGGGDVTLAPAARPRAYPAPADLATLAARVARALPAGGGPWRLRLDVSRWRGPQTAVGWTPSYLSGGDVVPVTALEVDEARVSPAHRPRYPHPAAAAGAAFAVALRAAGVGVTGAAGAGTAPAVASPVASVDSPPMTALVHRMLTDSDNDLAEALARAVAVHDGRPGSFAGAAAAVLARVASLGVPMSGVRMYDGSGLSRDDRVTPAALVAVLRAAVGDAHPALRPLLDALPVAGFTGTLADRYRHVPQSAGAGVVRAKTGTLSGVSSEAGLVVDADGRLLAFALLAGHAPSPEVAEAALDRVVATLARCGCH